MTDTIFLGGDIEITIGGVKLNGFKDLKMKNEDKYIPKVGEAFECYNAILEGWYSFPKVVLITDKQVVYLDDTFGLTASICLTGTFRPIQTKADVERQELLLILNSALSDESTVSAILLSGFTIPKKIKRSDVLNVVESFTFPYSAVTLTNEICNLLGDLVEQD